MSPVISWVITAVGPVLNTAPHFDSLHVQLTTSVNVHNIIGSLLKLDLAQITHYMVCCTTCLFWAHYIYFPWLPKHENQKLPRNFHLRLQFLCNCVAGPKDVLMSAEGGSSWSMFLQNMPYLPAKVATKLHCSSKANYFIRILMHCQVCYWMRLLFNSLRGLFPLSEFIMYWEEENLMLNYLPLQTILCYYHYNVLTSSNGL